MTKKILISQPQPTTVKSPYYDIEEEFGVKCVFRPFFKVEGIAVKDFLKQRVNILDYTGIVFTSRHAIDHFFNLVREMRIKVPETMKYFCTLEKIALYIQKYVQYRKRKVFFTNTGKIDDLVPVMLKHKSEKYLIPMSSVHDDSVKNLLDKNKLIHTECVMYRPVSNDFTEEEIKSFDFDMIIFFSPTGVKALKKNIPGFKQDQIKIAAFGPATAKAVTDEGLRLDLQAPSEEFHSMPSALRDYLQKQGK